MAILIRRKRLTAKQNVVAMRELAFDMIRYNGICNYSEDCEHELCQRVHHVITDCNFAYTAIQEARDGKS